MECEEPTIFTPRSEIASTGFVVLCWCAVAGSLIRTHVGLRFLKKVWRATADTSANFFIRFCVKKRKVRAEKSLARPHVQVLLKWAEMWQAPLDSGGVKTRVEIAKRFGVAVGRVSNIMNLIKLAPEIQGFIRSLPAGTSRRVISVHGLRELARMQLGEQTRRRVKVNKGQCVVHHV